MTDLIETIVQAATAAIRNQAPAIMTDAGHLVSVTIELELSNGGDEVIDSTCWTERRGVHRRKGAAA